MAEDIFCKIIANEISATKVYENDGVVAFMDVNPIADGHTIVIPKKHVEEFYQLESDDYHKLMDGVKEVAKAIKEVYNPPRVGVIVYGFHVAHAHIHLYPNTGEQITMHQQADYPEEKREQEAKKLRSLLEDQN